MEAMEPAPATTRVWRNPYLRGMIWDALNIEEGKFSDNAYLLLISKETFDELARYIWWSFRLLDSMRDLSKKLSTFSFDRLQPYLKHVKLVYLPFWFPRYRVYWGPFARSAYEDETYQALAWLDSLTVIFPNYSIVADAEYNSRGSFRINRIQRGDKRPEYEWWGMLAGSPTSCSMEYPYPELGVDEEPFHKKGLGRVWVQNKQDGPGPFFDAWRQGKGLWVLPIELVQFEHPIFLPELIAFLEDLDQAGRPELWPHDLVLCADGTVTAEDLWRLMAVASRNVSSLQVSFCARGASAILQVRLDDLWSVRAAERWRSLGNKCKVYALPVTMPPAQSSDAQASPLSPEQLDLARKAARSTFSQSASLNLARLHLTFHGHPGEDGAQTPMIAPQDAVDRLHLDVINILGPVLGPCFMFFRGVPGFDNPLALKIFIRVFLDQPFVSMYENGLDEELGWRKLEPHERLPTPPYQ